MNENVAFVFNLNGDKIQEIPCNEIVGKQNHIEVNGWLDNKNSFALLACFPCSFVVLLQKKEGN